MEKDRHEFKSIADARSKLNTLFVQGASLGQRTAAGNVQTCVKGPKGTYAYFTRPSGGHVGIVIRSATPAQVRDECDHIGITRLAGSAADTRGPKKVNPHPKPPPKKSKAPKAEPQPPPKKVPPPPPATARGKTWMSSETEHVSLASLKLGLRALAKQGAQFGYADADGVIHTISGPGAKSTGGYATAHFVMPDGSHRELTASRHGGYRLESEVRSAGIPRSAALQESERLPLPPVPPPLPTTTTTSSSSSRRFKPKREPPPYLADQAPPAPPPPPGTPKRHPKFGALPPPPPPPPAPAAPRPRAPRPARLPPPPRPAAAPRAAAPRAAAPRRPRPTHRVHGAEGEFAHEYEGGLDAALEVITEFVAIQRALVARKPTYSRRGDFTQAWFKVGRAGQPQGVRLPGNHVAAFEAAINAAKLHRGPRVPPRAAPDRLRGVWGNWLREAKARVARRQITFGPTVARVLRAIYQTEGPNSAIIALMKSAQLCEAFGRKRIPAEVVSIVSDQNVPQLRAGGRTATRREIEAQGPEFTEAWDHLHQIQ